MLKLSNILSSRTKFFVKIIISVLLFKAFARNYITQSAKMSEPAIKTLNDFGYAFDSDGKLKKINQETGGPGDEGFDFNISEDQAKNQKHYEALGEVITNHVYKLLEENGMHKIYIPDDVPKEEATFIFLSKPKLEKPKKLLVLIHGSGVVRAGQWARSLIINHSLDHGTQLPYIKTARELGYDILITNTNDNYRTIDQVEKPIPGNSSPRAHAFSVWEKFVIGSNPDCVAIVAHSFGGVVTIDLAKKYPDFFKSKVFAIAFTDSVHSIAGANEDIRSFLKNVGRNWVTSNKPLDEVISTKGNDISLYSAGHTKHEWTSYSCMSALFDFLRNKHSEFLAKERISKSDL